LKKELIPFPRLAVLRVLAVLAQESGSRKKDALLDSFENLSGQEVESLVIVLISIRLHRNHLRLFGFDEVDDF
jgi:hypothetical protein